MWPPVGSTKRLLLGALALLLVNFLWVGSSELSEYIFSSSAQNFNRPFFTCYFKTCMFMLYLLGLICKCHRSPVTIAPSYDAEPVSDGTAVEPVSTSSHQSAYGATDSREAEREEDFEIAPGSNSGSICANETKTEAPDAVVKNATGFFDRLDCGYTVTKPGQLPLKTIFLLALQFVFLWFIGSTAYQYALSYTTAGVVNVISSTSSLFTLVLASFLPSNENDRFTISKLAAVLLSSAGVFLITYFDDDMMKDGLLYGVIASLIGALAYALYLVLLKRKATDENKIDIPLFFGFVGLLSFTLIWPVFLILDKTNVEHFYPLPTGMQVLFIALNGLLGTVLSEYLWLLGCLLTSSLIATLSLSLMTPLTIIADMLLWQKTYPLTFLIGAAFILISFVVCSVLEHRQNWDPVMQGLYFVRRRLQRSSS